MNDTLTEYDVYTNKIFDQLLAKIIHCLYT